MKTPFKQTLQRGFSLVELLVVIAVIAIIAAIAIPNIANITGSAQDSADRRNAQNIASTAAAARAAGYTNEWDDSAAAISALAAGIQVENPVGSGNFMTFRVDSLNTNSAAAMAAITNYLRDDGTNVYYNPNN